MKYLMSLVEQDVINAIARIDLNCGFPNSSGTNTWDEPKKAYNQDIWFLFSPPSQGYMTEDQSFSQAEMMDGVINVTPSDGDVSWFPEPEDL